MTPIGSQAGAPPVPQSGVSRFSRSISLGRTFDGWFNPESPVRNTEMRSLRWIPAVPGSESGTDNP